MASQKRLMEMTAPGGPLEHVAQLTELPFTVPSGKVVKGMIFVTASATGVTVKDEAGTSVVLGNVPAGWLPISITEITTSDVDIVLNYVD